MTRAIRKPRKARRGPRPALVLIAYAVLLVGSHVVRHLRVEEPVLGPEERSVELPAVARGVAAGGPVRVVYRDVSPPGRPDAPALLLLHGSPGRKEDFRGMLPRLGSRYRVIAPDLPGFGKSERDVTDYSIAAHAIYARELLDRLGVARAHVVGFSMGGGVALELYEAAPERVASLVLLSSIGVQELELLGGYRINHAIHGVQLAGLTLVHEGLPHMGLLDRSFLDVAYARNFYDTDQRPLRGILSRFEPPMLILHGERDLLVPPAAAREHHRLVPQSELALLPSDHFMTFTRADATAREIEEFLDRVERGQAPTRAAATLERLRAAARPFDAASVPPFTGATLLVVVALIALATLVSEDLACVATGLLVADGRLGLLAGVVACSVGIYVGDMLLFLAGRWLGRPALRFAPLRWWIRPAQVELSSRWFERRGPAVVLLSRFLPGARLPTYFAAGVLHTRFWAFALWFALAVALWTPLLVGASALLGSRLMAWVRLADRWAPLAVAGLLLALFVLVKLAAPALSRRGRRLLKARWLRLRRWEYWPPWVFYPPVVAWVLWLGLKHRAPLLFTAANPAIEAGGFINESKWRTLEALAASGAPVARSHLVPHGELDRGAALVQRFMEARALDYPVVLKPDAGQRGSGVAVARSRDDAERYFAGAAFDVVVQEHVPGVELGIFYYRYPGEQEGRIFSVTDKRLPEVEGDGRRTLEELILAGRDTLPMARHHLAIHADRLDRIPAAGERVRLTELGTHCRGAVFRDGRAVLTPALERAIDRIGRGYRGFYFGRFDLRAPSPEAFAAGEGFKIIELNGVTSEATHIYDAGFGVLDAWRVLFEQWRIAFEIGRLNRRRGHAPAALGSLLRSLRDYRRAARSHPAQAPGGDGPGTAPGAGGASRPGARARSENPG